VSNQDSNNSNLIGEDWFKHFHCGILCFSIEKYCSCCCCQILYTIKMAFIEPERYEGRTQLSDENVQQSLRQVYGTETLHRKRQNCCAEQNIAHQNHDRLAGDPKTTQVPTGHKSKRHSHTY
jgi:hypothetical protein